MLRRVMGLIMIVSILMPILLGVAGALIVRQIVADVEDVARGPLRDIRAALDDMKSTLDEASRAFQGLAGQIASIGNTVSRVANSISAIASRIGPLDIPDFDVRIPVIDRRVTIRVPDIPAFDVPGLSQLKRALSSAFGIFDDLVDVLGRIGSIGSLPQQLNGVVANLRALIDDLGAAGGRWLGVLGFIGVVLLVWVSATYVALAYRWLSSGWRMLRGLPA